MKELKLSNLKWLLLWTFLTVVLFDAVDSAKNSSRAAGIGIRNYKKAQHRSKLPLKPEDGRRKSKRSGECRLGKQVHEIGDAWSPDLGEPFGVMYCIECSCEAVQRKRRIVGRIRCRNIKNECPKLDCPDATTIPGQCCKMCPEVLQHTDNQTSDGLSIDETDMNENNKEYAALLTPRSSSQIISSTGLGEPLTAGLAAGRFMFLHRNLYYSFVYNSVLARPKYVQFVDADGNVVEEQEVTNNNYQHETKKICGVWRKMARVYRKLLKEEKLFAALVTEKLNGDNDRFLAGRVAKQRYVATELYSSLLESSTQAGTGGMSMITTSSATGSIYLNIVFNGDFDEERDIEISVRISDSSGSGAEESVILPKILYDINNIEVRSILESDQLKSLSRGTLFIVVYSKKNPDFKLIGFVQSRTTCDIFDTVLSSEESSSISSGLAWIYPLPEGSWSYNIHLPEEHIPIALKLETGRKVLEELPIALNSNMTRESVSGMTSRHYQLLYEEGIYLSVLTNKGNLRGKLAYRGFGDAQLSDTPLILEPGTRSDFRAQGLVWIGIDSSCNINYQVTLSERPQSELMRLELVEMPGLHMIGVPVQSYVLDDFEASEYEGEFNDLQKSTFVHISAGDALFKVVRVNDSSTLASTAVSNVRVPGSCLPARREIDPYIIEPEDDTMPNPAPSKCFYDGQMREEYSQWTPANDTCQICNCFKGNVRCDAFKCPTVNCPNPILLSGECCRTCFNMNQSPKNLGRGCDLKGDRFHPAGSSWHPYFPPDGFMVCTTCTCNVDTLTVECVKEACPTLTCAASDAFYPRPLSCCKVCSEPLPIDKDSAMDDVFVIQRKEPTEAEILADGGCKFRGELHSNGEEWNHRIEPFGFTPCFVCSCRNGSTKCGKVKCPILTCITTVKEDGVCCSRCSEPGDTMSSLSGLRKISSVSVAGKQMPPTRYKKLPIKQRTRPGGTRQVLAIGIAYCVIKKKKERVRSKYFREILKKRGGLGEFTLVKELKEDPEYHFRYFIMSKENFEEILSYVGPIITHNMTHETPIGYSERLALTLRYIAGGSSQISLEFIFEYFLHQLASSSEKPLERFGQACQQLLGQLQQQEIMKKLLVNMIGNGINSQIPDFLHNHTCG